ncbi:hypothetical protein J2Z66_003141 [Paenibacillus eucommiae]|uniref:Uncharacterized protein n=1 Tax=Paenibacillus eucommiae TaxID=1355755 RepID=A0ABS4IVD7_9BACL|nr:hypothetical protein [Paenibacillus eucommiae]
MFFIVKVRLGKAPVLLAMKNIVKVANPSHIFIQGACAS